MLPGRWVGLGQNHDTYLRAKYFENLDGLRALAILGVLWHHLFDPIEAVPVTGRGFLGVDLFFVLSGFLIVTLLLREKDRNGRISMRDFYIRRTLRIFPLYFLVVGLVGAAAFIFDRGTLTREDFLGDLPYLLTYTTDFVSIRTEVLDVTWSLAAEEQFYLVWPWLILALTHRAALWAAVVGIGLNAGYVCLAEDTHLAIQHTSFAPMLMGVLVAHWLHAPGSHARLAKLLGGRHAAPLTVVLVVGLVGWPHRDIVGPHRLAIQVSMAAMVAAYVLRPHADGWPLLQSRPARWVGRVSYGLYLWHNVAVLVITRVWPERGLVFGLACTAGSFAIAELSFRYFERPFLALKKRFATPDAPPAQTAPVRAPAPETETLDLPRTPPERRERPSTPRPPVLPQSDRVGPVTGPVTGPESDPGGLV